MLVGTGLTYHHVGGGSSDDLETLEAYAKKNNVNLIIEPRLSQDDLVNLIKRSLAVVSLAHGEPFGLTPIEAQAAGTPAIMVDEGGYKYTIEDGVSGRLLPRGNWSAWHTALEQARDSETRKAWSSAGQENIAKIGLRPEDQADALNQIISKIRD